MVSVVQYKPMPGFQLRQANHNNSNNCNNASIPFLQHKIIRAQCAQRKLNKSFSLLAKVCKDIDAEHWEVLNQVKNFASDLR